MGLFFSLVSTSLIASDKLDTNSYFFFFKHLAYIFLEYYFNFFFIISKKIFLDFQFFIFYFFIFFIFSPIIGTEVKGSKRWLDLFFLPRFQPIEIVKPFTIIFLATILSSEKNIHIYYKYFLSFIAIFQYLFINDAA